MSSAYTKDTIAAIATAPGRGGIGIVRVSGAIASRIAESIVGICPEPRLATLAEFRASSGKTLDRGIALYFKAPNSFTGEDVLELQGHGGPVVLDMVLSQALELGARLAEPGEFSKRAFLNDKLDLAQAEAVSDLINSGTRQAAAGAMRSLQGRLSDFVTGLISDVMKLRVHVEAALDFPEEEIDFLNDKKINGQLQDILAKLTRVLSEAETGALLSEGAAVVLVGKPNAGKSSLMNRFTGRETSIVTSLPGTTRDVVEEQMHIDGIPLQVIDTAGIREGTDVIEVEGVRRAITTFEQADLALVIVDASLENPEIDLQELSALTDIEKIAVYNKMDLVEGLPLPNGVLPISARTGFGMEQLKAAIKSKLAVETVVESGFTARTRHVSALQRALAAVERGVLQLETNRATEFLAEELKQCQTCLSEITGEFSADALLGEIFSSFCIGK